MSAEEIIVQAGQATRRIKSAIGEARMRLEGLPATCNAYGVLIDHGFLLAEVDEIVRLIQRDIQDTVVKTQWPKAAEYSEV